MEQAREPRGDAGDPIGDYDAIRRVVQLCLDGEAKGDVAKLEEAFHEEARMFGDLAGTRYDVPIQALFDMAAEGADRRDQDRFAGRYVLRYGALPVGRAPVSEGRDPDLTDPLERYVRPLRG